MNVEFIGESFNTDPHFYDIVMLQWLMLRPSKISSPDKTSQCGFVILHLFGQHTEIFVAQWFVFITFYSKFSNILNEDV